jgi:hypothetical protein
MDAMPIVPPLFRATKNTTLHELQTGDRSRATDSVRFMDGTIHLAEIHWYEAAGIGRKEYKIKYLL